MTSTESIVAHRCNGFVITICFEFCFQELFITYLAQQTQRKNTGNRELNYEDLASFVQHNNKLEFLHEILPEKITVKQFREILARGDQSDSDNNTSDSDEDSSLTNDDDDEDDDDDDEDDSEGDK